MLAISQTSLVASQVRQRMDVSALAGDIDQGLIHALAFGRVNASVAGTSGGTSVTSFDLAQSSSATAYGVVTPDGDPGSWEPALASLVLPVGTRFVEHQFQFSNATLPIGETGYGDAAGLVLSKQVMTAAEHLNAQTLVEATATGYCMIQTDLGLDPQGTFSWSGTFDATGWTSSVSGTLYGSAFSLDYSGSSLSMPSGDVEVSFVGTGMRGVDPIAIAGTAMWELDPMTSTFVTMVYDSQGSVDDPGGPVPRVKWWVRALEILGGGGAGAASGIAGGPWTIGLGAFSGAVIGWAVSEEFAQVSTDGSDPPQPPTPSLPDVSHWFMTGDLVLGPNQLYTSVSGAGTLEANLFNEVQMSGTWSSGSAVGVGSTTDTIGTNYCSSVPNSTGLAAVISASGSTSVAENDLTLFCGPLPVPDQPGLFFFGPNQTQLPFGNGFRCIATPIVRINPPQSSAAGMAMRVVDLSALGIPAGTQNFQYWYRDPMGGQLRLQSFRTVWRSSSCLDQAGALTLERSSACHGIALVGAVPSRGPPCDHGRHLMRSRAVLSGATSERARTVSPYGRVATLGRRVTCASARWRDDRRALPAARPPPGRRELGETVNSTELLHVSPLSPPNPAPEQVDGAGAEARSGRTTEIAVHERLGGLLRHYRHAA